MNVVEKTVKFHYNGTPTKSGWYYCATTDKLGSTDSDVIFYDLAYDEWQCRRNERIICWIEPLDELLEKELVRL